MRRPIALGLSPNVEKDDAVLALRLLFGTTQGTSLPLLKNWFSNYFGAKTVVPFTSGRGALYAVLTSLNIQKGDEVLVQAFTCSAVIDAIMVAGGKPVYVDITKEFVLDEKDLERKRTRKTKVLLLQHTFGIPNTRDGILSIARKHNISIVEDVAHTIGATEKGKKLGSIGVASIFSFGRDKAFSCVSGGVAITGDKALGERLQNFEKTMTHPSFLWTFQNLLHPVAFYFVILPLYDFFSLGKLILVLLQKLHLLSFPVEKNGQKHFEKYTHHLPPALAQLALNQLEKLERFNTTRIHIAAEYTRVLKKPGYEFANYATIPLLRFPVLVENPVAMKQYFRKQQVYLGNWYSHVIDPQGTNLERLGYRKGTCPMAEEIAAHIVNLPTYPTMTKTDVKKIVMMVNAYAQSKTNNQ